jgi:hypothetical protein
MGPGSLNIAGPTGTTYATIGSNLSGIAYSELGFATPFLNVGPNINPSAPLGTIGGWQVYGTGPSGGNFTDLVARLINTGGTGLTGPVYSLIYNNGYTGPTGAASSVTGPTGPAVNANINLISNTGFTGPFFTNVGGATGIQYFLGSVSRTINLQINSSSASNKYLIYASCQLLASAGIQNVSASIIRSQSPMFGLTINTFQPYVNLANNSQSDVIYPPLHTASETSIIDLNTSLWSYSTPNANNSSPNGITINMQAYDTGITGTNYYAIRVDTDFSYLYYGNIRMSSVNFS